MKKRFFATLCCLLALTLNVSPLAAQTLFKKALQEKYGFRSVSCYTCHAKGKDADGKLLGKEHRNDFGKAMEKALVGKEKKSTGSTPRLAYAFAKGAVWEAIDSSGTGSPGSDCSFFVRKAKRISATLFGGRVFWSSWNAAFAR